MKHNLHPLRRKFDRHKRTAEVEMESGVLLGVVRSGQPNHKTSEEMVNLSLGYPTSVLALQRTPGRFDLWGEDVGFRGLNVPDTSHRMIATSFHGAPTDCVAAKIRTALDSRILQNSGFFLEKSGLRPLYSNCDHSVAQAVNRYSRRRS